MLGAEIEQKSKAQRSWLAVGVPFPLYHQTERDEGESCNLSADFFRRKSVVYNGVWYDLDDIFVEMKIFEPDFYDAKHSRHSPDS